MITRKKIFGIFNLLDVVIIGFIIALVIPGVSYFLKYNTKGEAEQKLLERYLGQQERGTPGTVTASVPVDVVFKDVPKEVADKIRTGDKEKTPGGEVLSEIIWRGETGPNYYELPYLVDFNNRARTFVPDRKDLYSIKAKMLVRGLIGEKGGFFYKLQNFSVGQRYTFISKDYTADYIVERPKNEAYMVNKTGYIEVNASIKNLSEKGIKAIALHDKELGSDGAVLCEIVGVGKARANYFFTENMDDVDTYIPLVLEDGSYSLPVRLRLHVFIDRDGNILYKGERFLPRTMCALKTAGYTVEFVFEPYPFTKAGKNDHQFS